MRGMKRTANIAEGKSLKLVKRLKRVTVTRNEKGLTLLETMAGILVVTVATTIFFTFIVNITNQKNVQKEKVIAVNLAAGAVENMYTKLETCNWEGCIDYDLDEETGEEKYTLVIEVEESGKEYVITTEAVKERGGYETGEVGKLLKLNTKVTSRGKSEEIDTYVYQE